MLLPHDDRKVGRDQRPERDRDHEHVDDVEARQELAGAGERAGPDERREPGPDDRDGDEHRVSDREPHPREQVVGQRVTRVALEHRERQHRHADRHVEVTRLPEGAREEDPHQVQDDRGDEDVRGPVVRLAHQEARLDA